MSEEWVIWLFEGIVVAAATSILLTKSVFHAGLNLLIIVLSIGVIFGMYGSEFLFIAQVMIYGGGILVLILFATMVTQKKISNTTEDKQLSIPMIFAAAGAIVLVAVWVMAYQPTGIPYVLSTTQLGKKLLLDYPLPLEISGVLLLVSLIGATLSSIQKPNAS